MEVEREQVMLGLCGRKSPGAGHPGTGDEQEGTCLWVLLRRAFELTC